MKINILRKMEYEGLFIYVMQFCTTFQYLFALDDGSIHQDNVQLNPRWNMWLEWKFGRIPMPYNGDELDEGEQIVLSGAMITIDELKKSGKLNRQGSRARKRSIQKIKSGIESKKGLECHWYTTETIDGWYYQCTVHKQSVKVAEGVKPVHN